MSLTEAIEADSVIKESSGSYHHGHSKVFIKESSGSYHHGHSKVFIKESSGSYHHGHSKVSILRCLVHMRVLVIPDCSVPTVWFVLHNCCCRTWNQYMQMLRAVVWIYVLCIANGGIVVPQILFVFNKSRYCSTPQ